MMPCRSTQCSICWRYKKKEDAVAVFHCSTWPRLMVSIPSVNGRYLCESVMHYLRVNTVETERPSSGGAVLIVTGRRRHAHLS